MIEPAGTVAGGRPLVVPVHGSERTSALNSAYGYSLAAQGIAVFVYDKQGHEELGKVRSELAQRSWSQRIRGEYSGEILRMTDDELRCLGRARFDNIELIWDYDSVAALQRVQVRTPITA